jgi:hypothetical protein
MIDENEDECKATEEIETAITLLSSRHS